MHTKWLPTLGFGLSMGLIACGSSTPDPSNSGGTGGAKVSTGGGGAAGSSAGGPSTAGSVSGGSANGGTASGGSAAGGTAGSGTNGGNSSGGMAAGGGAGRGGASTGGSSGSGGSAGGGTGGKGDPVPSPGCTVTDGLKTLTTGGMSIANGPATSTRLKITSGGMGREYIIDIPADYDPKRPYRLIFSWHQAYGSDTGNAIGQYPANNGPNFDAKNYAYFGLRREAMAANEPAIFVAPGGIGNLPWDFKRDSALFDELLTLVNANLCIDKSRVFTTGFSFGAMMSYSLSITRQKELRAAVTMAPANYNLPNQPTNSKAGTIAYFGITGMSDGTCPWVSGDESAKRGGKFCALTHAADNGCTIPGNIQTAMVGSKKYLCYDFEGCKAGYPVKVCTFDGAHTPSSISDGTSGGDDGLKAFVPPMAWKFIAQF